MGSTCCKRYDSPYSSPHIPDFTKLFTTCSEQFNFCQRYKPREDEIPPKTRRFSPSDISAPIPIGCTLAAPKRPPRKRKCRLSRSQSMIIELVTSPAPLQLARSKSIHDIAYKGNHDVYEDSEDIAYNMNRHLYEDTECVEDIAYMEPVTPLGLCLPIATILNHDGSLTSRLEPILESDYEESAAAAATLESPPNSLNDLVADNKRHFLATLLAAEDNNNQLNSLPSRKSSITESLREFESSLYDMLEQQQESTKDEIEEIKWKPQIPIY